jgi:hypothetical protein
VADWRNPLDAIGAVGAGARNLVSRLDEALHHLEQLVDGVLAMQKELAGMRRDVKALGNRVDGLRGDVQAMHAGVGGIRGATESLDQRFHEVPEKLNAVEERLGSLTGTLESVDALASRFGRFGRRNRKARGDAEPVPDEVEQALLDAEAVRSEAEAADDRPA